jgi:anti-sigma factor RsiW
MNGQESETDLLLSAYFDGELEVFAAHKFEARLKSEPALASAYERLKALRITLRRARDEDVPSNQLRWKLTKLTKRSPPNLSSPRWSAMAASFIGGVLLSGVLSFALLQFQRVDDTADQAVASHIRALMAPQPVDVFSSDRHTVKPWFAGKLAFTPDVIDFANEGFPLVGGRVDIMHLEAVPSLIYRHGNHLISLMEVPHGRPISALLQQKDKGYLVFSWSKGAVTYWAISDASPETMQTFARLVRKAQDIAN